MSVLLTPRTQTIARLSLIQTLLVVGLYNILVRDHINRITHSLRFVSYLILIQSSDVMQTIGNDIASAFFLLLLKNDH